MGALVANGLIQKDALDIHRKLSISNHHSKTTRKDLPANTETGKLSLRYIVKQKLDFVILNFD